MKSLRTFGCFLAAACIVVVPSLAQPANPGMGMPRYDTSTETNLKGTVEDVLHPQNSSRRGTMGIHLMVKTDTGTIEVHLGPSSYVTQQGFTFAKGDVVEVVGSKVTIDGTAAVIAREVVKDGKTLTLRDKTGRPKWAGRRS